MVKIVSVDQIVEIERATDAAGVSYPRMMESAGHAVAQVVKELLIKHGLMQVLVLVGPGNNGGDGLVAARVLKTETDAAVSCYLYRERPETDPVYRMAVTSGVRIILMGEDRDRAILNDLVSRADIVVDSLLGTGTRLPVKGGLHELLNMASRIIQDRATPVPEYFAPGCPDRGPRCLPFVVAVDCPSGLDCDTGQVDDVTIPADITVTFAAVKIGLITFPGAGYVGDLRVAGIGTPPDLPEYAAINRSMVTGQDARNWLPDRPLDGHKGTFGHVTVIGGSLNYVGAPVLAAEAAYRAGAGLVTVAVPQPVYAALSGRLREAIWLPLPHESGVLSVASAQDLLGRAPYDAVVLGPGLGQAPQTAGMMRTLLSGGGTAQGAPASGSFFPRSLVIDADGLNLLAGIDNWFRFVPENTVITPHPGEMARLCGIDRETVLARRLDIAMEMAECWGCVLVLKGAYTVIADPAGAVWVVPFATDALATAGTGDVLAGLIGGMLAQGKDRIEAASLGAYIHGLAGKLAGEELGNRSVMSGDVLDAVPSALQRIAI